MTGRSNTFSTRETMHGRDTFLARLKDVPFGEPTSSFHLQHRVSQLGNTPLCVAGIRRAVRSEMLKGSLNRRLSNPLQGVISSG